MAKGKNLNPADSFRKALRKKELKKHKAERSKARDFALVKKDTRELEEDVEKLEAIVEPSSVERARLTELKSDLEKINKKKEEYVEEHPEQRRLVYRARRRKDEEEESQEPKGGQKRNIFKKNGLPRHPERSIYYDPVMNPFGVAPPGMPYMERPLRPDEVDSAEENEEPGSSDDDIAMPEGPAPGTSGVQDTEDSDDDIPMPEGPPPPKERPPQHAFPPPPFTSFQPNFPYNLPPPPPLFPSSKISASPSQGFITPPFPNPPLQMPPPPLGFFSRRQQSSSAMQDPLSSTPHETFQAHRSAKHPSLHPNLSTPPQSGPQHNRLRSIDVPGATITAAPELRDLKKEATAFMPASLKRRKAGASTSKVNAAPSLASGTEGDSEPTLDPVRPDLLGTLKDRFGSTNQKRRGDVADGGAKEKDDYKKFVEEMGDILGS